MAEFPRRYAPATLRLKELIATRLGRPRLLFCHQRSVEVKPNSAAAGAMPFHPTFTHALSQVDWCRYVVDSRPTSVQGVMHYGPDGAEDYRMMSLDFSPPDQPGRGAVAQISCGRYVPDEWQEAIAFRPLPALQVSCEKGIAFIDLPAALVWFDEAGRHQESLDSERPLGELLLAQFHRSVTSLIRRTSDLEDACMALRIVQAARQSHETGARAAI
jgi:predicted dehydrogenase